MKNFIEETTINNLITQEIDALKCLKLGLQKAVLPQVLDLMQNTQGRVVFTGMGKSGIIAQKLWLLYPQRVPRQFLFIRQRPAMGIWE